MKRIALAALLLLLPALAIAQETPCTDPNSEYVTTLRIVADLPKVNGQNAASQWDVILDRSLPSGKVQYSILAGSIRFTGSSEVVNATSTAALFELLAKASIAEGTARGYTPCSPCTDSVKVLHAMCVSRTGTGISTVFSPCGVDCSTRYYNVCCLDGPGSLVITPLSCTTSLCTGCQGTCN